MGRVNKFTDGVFTDIVASNKRVSEFEIFINVQDTLKKPKGDLKQFLSEYTKLTKQNTVTINRLASLEDVIMQIRTKENLSSNDIKLNVVREYIYARTTFHRKDTTTDDIRVIVGQTNEYGTDVNILSGNKTFMELAKNKLTSAMDEIINISKTKL